MSNFFLTGLRDLYRERMPDALRTRVYATRLLSTVVLQTLLGRISVDGLRSTLDTSRRQRTGHTKAHESFRSKSGRIADYQAGNSAVHRYLGFTRRALENAADIAADVYVAHGVEALPAAIHVSKKFPGLVYCDAIEVPSFGDRAIPTRWDDAALGFLDQAFEAYLQQADGIITVGWELGQLLKKYGRPVSVIPNYRHKEEFRTSNFLHDTCGLTKDHHIVLVVSSVSSGLESVLAAWNLLPNNYHLVCMGRLVPHSYNIEIHERINNLGLSSRVHLIPPIEYEKLSEAASGADVGLVVLDPVIKNHYASLPNRVFDYAAAGLPVVTPQIPDIARLVEGHNFGRVVGPTGPEDWSNAILDCVARRHELRKNALQAASALTWESIESQLFEALARPRSVTFFGVGDLTENNRTMRMCKTLVSEKVSVTVCAERGGKSISPGVRLHLLDKHL